MSVASGGRGAVLAAGFALPGPHHGGAEGGCGSIRAGHSGIRLRGGAAARSGDPHLRPRAHRPGGRSPERVAA
eukprot:4704390-Pyramimonas_sp.AAC.1